MFIDMKVLMYCLGPVQTNCYVLIDKGHALIIDPGDRFPQLDYILEENEAQLDAILLTHAHFDHIQGVDAIVDKYDVPVYIHPKEVDALTDPVQNGSQSFMIPWRATNKALPMLPGIHEIGPFTFKMVHTPGHSPGSSLFIFDDQMFAGDTIFQGSIGRTDLPGGNLNQMMASLEKVKMYDVDYDIYPGHGPKTTLNQEKQWNPYLR